MLLSIPGILAQSEIETLPAELGSAEFQDGASITVDGGHSVPG